MFGLLIPLLWLLGGCGSALVSSPHAGIQAFSIEPGTQSITTNGQVRFKATLASGQPAAVVWSVSGGQNDPALGEGTIDATGLYTPPAALSLDSTQVFITARLQPATSVDGPVRRPSDDATVTLTLTPGFLQPLAPETATLGQGGTLQVRAQIAEVNGGKVTWSLDKTPADNTTQGSLFSPECQLSPRNYTTCTVLYRAPATVAAGGESIFLRGTISDASGTTSTTPVAIRLSTEGITSTPLINQAAQAGPIELGASGGNNRDYDADTNGSVLECCGGTLGALVQADDSDQAGNGAQYILSNNHVLAESDQASTGDTILQPGLIDSGCSAQPARGSGRPIGVLKYYVPLATPQSNVDAALALVNSGNVDTSGSILQLAPAGNSGQGAGLQSSPPAGGKGETIGAGSFGSVDSLKVAKSGRTTGLTCSTVDAIDLDVRVDYFKDCAETQPFYSKTFTGQLGIPGNGFADSGDSGALVVDSRNAEPVGLLFATGTNLEGDGYSVANPIRDVLAELGTQAGHQLSIVGGGEHPVACLNYDRQRMPDQKSLTPRPSTPDNAKLLARLDLALQSARVSLVHRAQGVIGATIGRSADNPGEPAIVIYVDGSYSDKNLHIPALIDGLRTVVIMADSQSIDVGTAAITPLAVPGIHLPSAVLVAASEAQRKASKRLMGDPAIFGVGITESYDNPAEAALLVLADTHRTPRETPAVLSGLRVRYVFLDRLHVTKSKYAGPYHPSSCAVRSNELKLAPRSAF